MQTATTLSPSRNLELKPLKPMGWLESLLLFGIPAAVLAFNLLWLWPTLTSAGVARPVAYAFCLSLVNAGLLAAAVTGYIMEGNPLTWPAFSRRMRLARMTGRIWLWALLGTLVFGILALLIESLAVMFYKAIAFPIPNVVGVVMPVWMNVMVLLFNIFGEELWWRGYILPRQELSFGKYTWMLHGTLWAGFHAFKWWAVPFMLITCQIIPFVAQKTRNTWPGIINHMVINGASAILSAL